MNHPYQLSKRTTPIQSIAQVIAVWGNDEIWCKRRSNRNCQFGDSGHKKEVKLRAVGAGAVNQGIKAIAIARGYTAPKGYDLKCIPGFTTIESHDGEISAIALTVVPD